MEYILSLLKVVTIVVSGASLYQLANLSKNTDLVQLQIFIILGIAVNCGGNVDHQYIGGSFFLKGDAPFVGGIGGFASVFVTASFA